MRNSSVDPAGSRCDRFLYRNYEQRPTHKQVSFAGFVFNLLPAFHINILVGLQSLSCVGCFFQSPSPKQLEMVPLQPKVDIAIRRVLRASSEGKTTPLVKTLTRIVPTVASRIGQYASTSCDGHSMRMTSRRRVVRQRIPQVSSA